MNNSEACVGAHRCNSETPDFFLGEGVGGGVGRFCFIRLNFVIEMAKIPIFLRLQRQ